MTTVNFDIRVETPSLDAAQKQAEKVLEAELVAGVGEVLTAIEGIQIKKYTESDHPPRLKYQRTFTLRNASRTEVTRRTLPVIEGQWTVDESEAPYAEEVIGPRSQQKAIHRGRWLSQEDIEREGQEQAESIMEARLATLNIVI